MKNKFYMTFFVLLLVFFSVASYSKETSTIIPYGESGKVIRYKEGVRVHENIAVQYKKDWEEKIERIGNLNYPEVAKKEGFSATLIMDISVNTDGSLYDISIIESSGNKALDDAAKLIVKLSAPFPALPKELLEEGIDILRIRRVWRFKDTFDEEQK